MYILYFNKNWTTHPRGGVSETPLELPPSPPPSSPVSSEEEDTSGELEEDHIMFVDEESADLNNNHHQGSINHSIQSVVSEEGLVCINDTKQASVAAAAAEMETAEQSSLTTQVEHNQPPSSPTVNKVLEEAREKLLQLMSTTMTTMFFKDSKTLPPTVNQSTTTDRIEVIMKEMRANSFNELPSMNTFPALPLKGPLQLVPAPAVKFDQSEIPRLLFRKLLAKLRSAGKAGKTNHHEHEDNDDDSGDGGGGISDVESCSSAGNVSSDGEAFEEEGNSDKDHDDDDEDYDSLEDFIDSEEDEEEREMAILNSFDPTPKQKRKLEPKSKPKPKKKRLVSLPPLVPAFQPQPLISFPSSPPPLIPFPLSPPTPPPSEPLDLTPLKMALPLISAPTLTTTPQPQPLTAEPLLKTTPQYQPLISASTPMATPNQPQPLTTGPMLMIAPAPQPLMPLECSNKPSSETNEHEFPIKVVHSAAVDTAAVAAVTKAPPPQAAPPPALGNSSSNSSNHSKHASDNNSNNDAALFKRPLAPPVKRSSAQLKKVNNSTKRPYPSDHPSNHLSNIAEGEGATSSKRAKSASAENSKKKNSSSDKTKDPSSAAAAAATRLPNNSSNSNNHRNSHIINSNRPTDWPFLLRDPILVNCQAYYCPMVACANRPSLYSSLTSLEVHLVVEHGGLEHIKCPVPGCQVFTASNKKLVKHICREHRGSVDRIVCTECPLPLNFPVDFKTSQVTGNNKEPLRAAEDINSYLLHREAAHVRGVFRCGAAGCTYAAEFRNLVRSHIFKVHSRRALMQVRPNLNSRHQQNAGQKTH